MATMTMLEFLKTEAPLPERAVARLFTDEEPFFRVFPFETNATSGVPFNRETALASTTARAIGETYTATQGTIEPGFEPVKIQGGISPFDSFQVVTGSGSRRAAEAQSFVESVARNYLRDFIKGDDSSDPRIIRGLQLRQTDTDVNHVSQSAGAGTFANVLEAMGRCRRPTHWLMGRGMSNRVVLAGHDTTVGGYVTRDKDEMLGNVTVLADLPIIVVDRDGADAEILGFTEASSTTSMYCVSLRPDMVHGIQAAPPRAEDLGRDPSNGTVYNTVVDWFATFIVRHARGAVRYSGITDVAMTL
jgi:hypothetical protein